MDELLSKDMVEGKKAFNNFDRLVGKVLSVSREELARREEHHRNTTHLRGKKRGPKTKQDDALAVDEATDKTSEQPEA